VDNHWTTVANWIGTNAPLPGDNLLFSGAANAGTQSNFNNFPDGTVFGQLNSGTAAEQNFILAGNRLVLTNGVVESAPFIGGLPTFLDMNITLGAPQNFTASKGLIFNGTMDINGHSLTLSNSGGITFNGLLTNSSINSFPIVKTNAGSITVSSSANAALGLQIGQGTLVLNGAANSVSLAGANTTLVLDGVANLVALAGANSSLSGTGTAITLSLEGGNSVVTPGDNGVVGVMKCGNLVNDLSIGTLRLQINGTKPGTDYDQLLVYTNYSLNGSFSFLLNVQWGYTPQIGDSFLILDLVSGTPYTFAANGAFTGLPPGCLLDATNGSSLAVLYDTNGVTLKTVRTSASPFVLWKGSGPSFSAYGDRHWSSTNNWAQGLVPGSGSNVEFTPYQFTAFDQNTLLPLPYPPLTNDLPPATSLSSLLFSGTNYALYGNVLTITGGVTNQAGSGTNFCYLDLAASGPLPFEADPGGTFVLNGAILGSGTVSKEGGGTVRYTGTTASSFVGSVVVDSGTLQVDGSFTDGSFSVNGGMLDGTGTVSGVTMNGGTLKPGDSPGILHIQGDLSMTADAVFEAELNGPVPGTQYDQLQVNGGVSLNGATLNLQPGYAASPGAAFLILVNDGTDPIIGTFAGLPEGATFEAGGQNFSITYKGGSGNNDVVVTRVNVSPPGNFSSVNRVNPGVVQLQGLGGSNISYTIQANTNLTTTNWQDIGAVTSAASGTFSFSVSNVMSYPQRFFRTVTP
jgi:hypothetical protein